MPEIKQDIRAATFVVAANDSLHRNMADYVCDGTADQVEIQAAIDALPANGGEVILLEGQYNLSAAIVPDSYTVLRFVGRAILRPINGANISVIATNPGVANAHIRITGAEIDGNKANQTDGMGISLQNCQDCQVDNCYIHDVERRGIQVITTSTNNRILDNIIEDTGPYLGTGGDGLELASGSADTLVRGNIFIGNYMCGIEIEDAVRPIINSNLFISNAGNAAAAGIYIDSSGGYWADALIENNLFYDNNFDIRIDENPVYGLHITGNRFAVTRVGGANIYFNQRGEFVSINDNDFMASGAYVIAAHIWIRFNSDHIQIVGNRFDDNLTSPTNTIRCDFGKYILIVGNQAYRAAASIIYLNTIDGATTEIDIRNNRLIGAGTFAVEIAAGCTDIGVFDNVLQGTTAPVSDAGTGTRYRAVMVPFSDGSDPQDSGYLIDAGGELARAWLRLPEYVQQVMSIKIYARAVVLSAAAMRLEINANGGASNEPFGTHATAQPNTPSVTTNFAANDVIYWQLTVAGITALLGGDSVEVKVLHEIAGGGDVATNAYLRTVELEYV